jgi:hypothetical protein
VSDLAGIYCAYGGMLLTLYSSEPEDSSTVPGHIFIRDSVTALLMSVNLKTIFYDMIYLLTAIGLSPGVSSTVHIHTQTINRKTKNNNNNTQNNTKNNT